MELTTNTQHYSHHMLPFNDLAKFAAQYEDNQPNFLYAHSGSRAQKAMFVAVKRRVRSGGSACHGKDVGGVNSIRRSKEGKRCDCKAHHPDHHQLDPVQSANQAAWLDRLSLHHPARGTRADADT